MKHIEGTLLLLLIMFSSNILHGNAIKFSACFRSKEKRREFDSAARGGDDLVQCAGGRSRGSGPVSSNEN